MRALIFSITAGEGHNQVAKVLADAYEQKGHTAEIIDTFDYVNHLLKEAVSQGYLVSSNRFKKIYGKSYSFLDKRDGDSRQSLLSRIMNGVMATKLARFMQDYAPDVVVCTHCFPAIVVSNIVERFEMDVKTVGIVTDFTMHPFWEDTSLDYYVTANELLTRQAEKKGISRGEIVPLGIPINPKFAEKVDKQEARRQLGFEDKTTILVMGGSMGHGKIARTIKELDTSDDDFQVVTVCGRNSRMKRKIDALELKHRVYNFGFVTNVDLLMDASDCIITKPGGLTTSEALAKGLPMIMANPLPGQEDRNVEFLLNNGAAMMLSKTFPVDEALYQLFQNNVRLRNMCEVVAALGKPNATRDFVEFSESIVKD